ncbi:hypothetical protein R6Q59_015190 [Mikania micrantha]
MPPEEIERSHQINEIKAIKREKKTHTSLNKPSIRRIQSFGEKYPNQTSRRLTDKTDGRFHHIKYMQGVNLQNKEEVAVKLVLCNSYPTEFTLYLHYCQSLRFDDKPDYSYLKRLFRDLFIEHKVLKKRIIIEADNSEEWSGQQVEV